jgi:hypothetical protein
MFHGALPRNMFHDLEKNHRTLARSKLNTSKSMLGAKLDLHKYLNTKTKLDQIEVQRWFITLSEMILTLKYTTTMS